MYSKADGKITLLRNETSLFIDDLVALVIDSALADQLRELSRKIMGLTPGFTFNLSQARALRQLSKKTYKKYRAHIIQDVDLLSFRKDVYAIIEGNERTGQIFGTICSICNMLTRRLCGKEIGRREREKRIELECQDVRMQMDACREKIERCISESRGQLPNSDVYRRNERVFVAQRKQLALLYMRERTLQSKLLRDEIQCTATERPPMLSCPQRGDGVSNVVAAEKLRTVFCYDDEFASLVFAEECRDSSSGGVDNIPAEEPGLQWGTGNEFGIKGHERIDE